MSIKYNGKTIAGKYRAQIVSDATETDKGLIRIATETEITTGTDNITAVTPKNLKTELDKKQDVLTTGTGIKIENNTISNTQTSAEWGNITGTLSNQTDLQNALNTKASTTSVTNLETEVTDLSGRVTANEADIMLKANKTDLPTIATTSKTGLVKPDGSTIKVEDDGTISSNTGIDLGTILCMPFGVDESENKYRYLNGQTIVQSQYPAFTAKVKSWQSTRASLFTTETEWQAIKTASKLGQCGKFVIDNTAGTIRLPLIININGLTDLSNAGLIKDESLPNINGSIEGYPDRTGFGVLSGAFYAQASQSKLPTLGEDVAGYSSVLYAGFTAHNSSSSYIDNAPVQQEAVQYPYVICVNTGVEEAERPINQYEINNPYSYGDSKYYKGTLNNLSWLKSEGQWNSGSLYNGLYNWLLEKVNKGESGYKTVNAHCYNDTSTTYYLVWINAITPVVGATVYGWTASEPIGTISGITSSGFTYYDIKEKVEKTVTRNSDNDEWVNWLNDYDWFINTSDQTFRLPIKTGRVLLQSKQATSSDATWFNLYSDGWLEQGGMGSIPQLSANSQTVVYCDFDRRYKEQTYNVSVNFSIDADNTTGLRNHNLTRGKDKLGVGLYTTLNLSGSDGRFLWSTRGYSDEAELYGTNLYFFVGETVQSTNLMNLSAIIEEFANMRKGIMQSIYPVGSLYMSINAVNPVTLFGFGEWEQIKDRFILSAGDTYTNATTGGSATVSLSTSQLPAHNHTASTNSTGAHTHTRGTQNITGTLNLPATYGRGTATGALTATFGGTTASPNTRSTTGDLKLTFTASNNWTGSTSSNGAHTHTVTVGDTGSGEAHDNMPPYLAVNIWKRVS